MSEEGTNTTQQPMSMAPTRVLLYGTPTALQVPTLNSPAPPPPQETPIRLWVQGELAERPPESPPVERASPGEVQAQGEAADLARYRRWAMAPTYKTPEQWRALQAADNALDERQRYRAATGRQEITKLEERRR